MLPAVNRLRGDRMILTVLRKGRRVHSPALTLHIGRAPTAVPPRATVVVGKKLSKSAVVRNRVKRRVRAILAAPLATAVPAGTLLIVIARPPAAWYTFADLKRELTTLLVRARLLPS